LCLDGFIARHGAILARPGKRIHELSSTDCHMSAVTLAGEPHATIEFPVARVQAMREGERRARAARGRR
jgi:hypothetical protein